MAHGIKLIQAGVTLAPGTAVHPAPITVAEDILCFLSFTGASTTYVWTLSRPTGSTAVISSETSPGPSFMPDISGGAYTVTLIDDQGNVYVLDVQQASGSPIPGQGGTAALIVSVSWWGAQTANYFNDADGKWYVDSGFITEADDDAAKIQSAIDYVHDRGGGSVYVNGVWYLKDAPTGAHREFVVAKSNVTIYGDGEPSKICVGPGQVALGTGYGAIIGQLDYTTPANYVNDFHVSNVTFDHNSDFNQFPSPSWAGMGTFGALTYAVGIWAGSYISYENITIDNHNGIFGLGAGTYGFPDRMTDVRVKTIRFRNAHDDPNSGDSSKVAISATRFTVDDVVGVGEALPAPGNLATLSELHGFYWSASGIEAIDMGRALNIGADNTDATNFTVRGLKVTRCYAAITLYQGFGHSLRNFEIAGVSGTLRPSSTPGGDELGINVAINANQLWKEGRGLFDFKIHDVDLALDGTSAGGLSCAVYIAANTGDGVNGGGGEIYNIRGRGFGTAVVYSQPQNPVHIGLVRTFTVNASTNVVTLSDGTNVADAQAYVVTSSGALPAGLTSGQTVWIRDKSGATCQFAASVDGDAIDFTTTGSGTHTATQTSSNIVGDLHIHHVRGDNCGLYGVAVGSSSAEAAAVYRRLKVHHVFATDNRGGSSALQIGTYISAFCDANSAYWDNDAVGHVSAIQQVNTATFPTTGNRLEDKTLRTVTLPHNGVGVTAEDGVHLINGTAAAAGAQQQSPALLWTGQGWKTDAGGGSEIVRARVYIEPVQGTAHASSRLRFDFEIAGVSNTFAFLTSAGTLLLVGGLIVGVDQTQFLSGSGSPEGVVSARRGSLYADYTNGENYIKNTGAGNTGWKLVTHA